MKGGFWRGVSVAAGVGLAAIWGADFAGAQDVAGAITPVPGGVGPMTVALLLQNTVQAAEKQLS